jgi:large exoprotein involved in heme utilization and adhesion
MALNYRLPLRVLEKQEALGCRRLTQLTSTIAPSLPLSTLEPPVRGGKIDLQTRSLSLNNGAQVSAATSGSGRAGDISVYQADTIALNNSSISTSVNAGAVVNEAIGNRSGNINLQTRQLSLTNGAEVAAATSGQGNAGSIVVQEAEAVSLTNSSISTAVNAGAVGQGGTVDIQARSLSLNNEAQVSAATSGTGRAGDISVHKADTIALNNSSISTSVNTGAVGEGGKIDLQTRSLSLNNGAQVSAATSGKGQAGNISVREADAVSLTNSAISTAVNAGAVGQGGDIDIQTRSLSVRDQSRISASTSGDGKAGSITVAANTLEATNGGQLLTSTASSQDAGNINLTIKMTRSSQETARVYLPTPPPVLRATAAVFFWTPQPSCCGMVQVSPSVAKVQEKAAVSQLNPTQPPWIIEPLSQLKRQVIQGAT